MGVNWSDKSININWPEKVPLLSDKDKNLPMLKEIPENLLPSYTKV
jgi:dTDP-4-dehydrorhamnose 3,5-epimerase-like enzyme